MIGSASAVNSTAMGSYIAAMKKHAFDITLEDDELLKDFDESFG